MGARGNSGVILSQILRGVADAFRADPGGGGGATLVGGLGSGHRPAPRRRDAAGRGHHPDGRARRRRTAAAAAPPGGVGLVEVLEAARTRRGRRPSPARPSCCPCSSRRAWSTPAASASCCCSTPSSTWSTGDPLPEPPASAARMAADGRGAGGRAATAGGEDAVGDLRYEVMYFLEAPDDTIPAFKDVWAGVGDSIVVVGGDGLWNCHIHTDDIGAAIEAALDVGRPRDIRVTDLVEQVDEERWVREAARRAGARRPSSTSRSPARSWRSPPATASGASSAPSACSSSSPAASR